MTKTAVKTWGNWTLKNGYLVIKDSAGAEYLMSLKALSEVSKRLDFSIHMGEKNWTTLTDMNNLHTAFNELFNYLELSDGRTASEMVMTKLNEYYPLLRMR